MQPFQTLKGIDRSCIQSALIACTQPWLSGSCPDELLAIFFSLALIQHIENGSCGTWIYSQHLACFLLLSLFTERTSSYKFYEHLIAFFEVSDKIYIILVRGQIIWDLVTSQPGIGEKKIPDVLIQKLS